MRAVFKPLTLPFWYVLVCFLSTSGCTTETEIVLPAVPPKLVISSFISPEISRIEVSVSKSAALVSKENNGVYKPVKDATVWISDGTDSIQVPYNTGDSLYISNAFYPIKPGKRYWLRVTAPGGFAAHATCTVPVKHNTALTARIDSTQIGTPTQEGSYKLILRWPDLLGEGDYYRADAIMSVVEQLPPGSGERRLGLFFVDEPQVKDFEADGRIWEINSDPIANYRTLQRNGSLQMLQVYLYTTDQAYFEYHKSLYNYQLSSPFSDPIKLYSNVSGGLGI